MRWFTVTEGAFWRSFSVFFLTLPLSMLGWQALFGSIEEAGVRPPGLSLPSFHLTMILTAAFEWILFPVLLAILSSPLGISRHFAAFMIARNWGSLLLTLPYCAIGALSLIGLLNDEVASIATMILIGLGIRYDILNARWTLKANWSLAIGVATLAFLLGMVMLVLNNRLLGLV